MANREFLMLADTYNPDKHTIGGWYASIKYDGQRCFWDGGVTRGLDKREVPWSNTGKDERYVTRPIATGLWSRYGNVIHAPERWLNKLPTGVTLDGELYLDRGLFQQTRSIVSKIVPNESEWERIRFLVFDSPHPELVFQDGKINNPQFKNKIISEAECLKLYKKLGRVTQFGASPFAGGDNFHGMELVKQHRLPINEQKAREYLADLLAEEVQAGGEGLILRNPDSYWHPKRIANLLKVKPLMDAEGIVKGYVWGDGKLTGMMGAMIVEHNGKLFHLSGFTDHERQLTSDGKAVRLGKSFETVGPGIYNPKFKIGSTVSFKFMGYTNDGYPREPRYWRKA